MGCVSSTLLNHEEELGQLSGSTLGHHIVSLTSTTYGLLNLDPPPQPTHPPTLTPRFTLGSVFPSPLSEPRGIRVLKPLNDSVLRQCLALLDGFERLCPPNGENRVVVYTTTLRGVRKTFEDCNAVRAAIEGLGVSLCERDISMDRGFKEELRELMKGKDSCQMVPPRVFVKGRYVGGAEEVLKIVEEGCLGELLQGLPKIRAGEVCEGCGGVRFLPCFQCNGSCKMLILHLLISSGCLYLCKIFSITSLNFGLNENHLCLPFDLYTYIALSVQCYIVIVCFALI
ncbi:unnamed protein product, partial [Vitis vinifera]